MKSLFRRTLAMLLILVMAAGMLPVAYAQETAGSAEEPVVLTDEDYASADAVFAQIEKMEDAPAVKNMDQTRITDQAIELVKTSDSYVEGSLNRNGDSFTWMTDDGVRCLYNSKNRDRISRNENAGVVAPSGIYNEPVATKGGWPSSNQVYLIGPYYHDSSEPFTDQYKKEATAIAAAIGDTDGYTLYSGTAATVDKVAEALSNGAVVIFDSHGTTDYENPRDEYDFVTGATSSYLCLSSKSGLTSADFSAGNALYGSGNEAYVNGTAIAQRMTKNSPSGIVWMAICLGMATDSFYVPFRNKGVEVVYGYSQSVTFDGDYIWEEIFWDNMCKGTTVATAVSDMKNKAGEWDYCSKMYSYAGWSADDYGPITSISEAREYYYAFPIVVSDEDNHPGQRKGSNYGADSLQTVKSTYTLFTQYNITANSNNTAYGTVSVSGSTITASPAAGYFAQSATVLSGNATVSQNGNSFQVNASSDCSVQINFAPKTAVTVSFSGANVASQNGYAGDSMNLPTATAPDGFSFEGWLSAPLSADTTEEPTFYTNSFTPTGNTTLYALYSYVDDNTSSGTGDYVKVTETPSDWSGEYLIVYEAGSLVFNGSLTSLATANTVSITVNNGVISADEGDQYRFVIEPMTNGYSIKSASGKYISGTSGSNTVNAGTTAALNTINLDASGNADIVSNTSHLRYNNDAKIFRYYKASSYSSQQAIALYVKDGAKGTTYYTTNPTKCEHTNTRNVAAVAATCTQGGFAAGVQCVDCEVFISGHEPVTALGHNWSDWTQTVAPGCTAAGEKTHTCSACSETETQSVPATGHSYTNVVTPPTATEQGYTTYTCGNCGDSYVGNYVEALGQTYTVSFSVPAGVTSVADMTCGKAGITLPTADAPEGYTFEGWVTALTDDTENKPNTLTGTYKATANVTLYALYSYTEGGTGTTEYVLTDLSNISATDVVVVTMTYGNTVYALSYANGSSKAPAAPTVTVANGKLTTEPAAELQWNIGGSEDAYTFYPNGSTATWLYTTNTNNGTRVGTDSAKTFKLDSATGYLQHNGTGRYLGVYRTNPDWRCYTNTTGNTAGQTLGFYVKSAGGTTYYTTIGTAEPVAAAVYGANGKVDTYATLDEAIAACGENQYVKLMDDVEADLTLNKDLYIDLNGYILLGDITGDYTVYGMDSATDEYGLSDGCILGDIANVQTHVLTETAMTGDIYRYMAIQTDDGWTFNRYYVGITHITLRPDQVGLGYKAMLKGNELVMAEVDSFGYTLQLGQFDPISRTMNGINANGIVTLLVKNYMIEQYGETDLSAYVTVTLGGEEITSATQTTNMRQVVELINDNYTNYSAGKLAAVKELILTNEVMQSWDVANLLKEETEVDQTMVQIVEAAYNLAIGASMSEPSTLTGVITEIETPYSSQHKNISVVIAVAGAEDKPILCHRLQGEGADQIGVGDTITVTGTLFNYDNGADGIIEFAAGCNIDSWKDTAVNDTTPTDPIAILTAAYALADNEKLPYEATLTGTITKIDEAYSTQYQNITVTITISGAEDMPIMCYRMKGTGAEALAVGDCITVTGIIKNYKGTIEFDSGCTFVLA